MPLKFLQHSDLRPPSGSKEALVTAKVFTWCMQRRRVTKYSLFVETSCAYKSSWLGLTTSRVPICSLTFSSRADCFFSTEFYLMPDLIFCRIRNEITSISGTSIWSGFNAVNRDFKQATFLTTRTLTGSKFDVFDQPRPLLQSLWRPCCQKRRLLKLSNLGLELCLFTWLLISSSATMNYLMKVGENLTDIFVNSYIVYSKIWSPCCRNMCMSVAMLSHIVW